MFFRWPRGTGARWRILPALSQPAVMRVCAPAVRPIHRRCRGAQTARTSRTVVSQAWMAHWTHCAQAVHADAKRPATPTWQ
ncbi:hypothetical protein Xant_17235 [Xanthomonas cissicola]|uniref:Secreted protein n=1 Tax=Xanthomonas cissicola TaxID=86186 RepID=A0ABX3M3S3_9XANT|nr:hypothetical protein Xant_17235 [Xanthomonas cissicola]